MAEDPRDTPTFESTVALGDGARGAVIGPFHLLERIGQGGMGEVWLAEQKEPIRRRVALKLIKTGMDTHEVVARFQSERQALALMDYPAIARVFEASCTEGGRPYFAMEYVPGVPITTYCDEHKLTMRERLELFMEVCAGVQHAHQKAIIHRDLKPSNILVTEIDGKPRPKIIDFGVAKAIGPPLSGETMFTRAGAVLGTPEYMSPEQASSSGEDLDTRTDVYSLGVVLYEMMVGAQPLDYRKLRYDEVLRKLREEDAPSPSDRLRTLGEQSARVATNRRTDLPNLTRQLHGDLDAIALKALDKDRTRRYGTPNEMAADIGRYLRNDPVIAAPAGAGYRIRKYVRRHRLAVTAVAGLVLLLGLFATVEGVQLRRTRQERDRADRITKFLIGMFEGQNPGELRAGGVTARQILDQASANIDKELAADPVLRGQILHVIGTLYWNLGLFSQSQLQFGRAVDIRKRVLGPEAPDTLRSINEQALAFSDGNLPQKAQELLRGARDAERRVLGPDSPDTLRGDRIFAETLGRMGHRDEAEKLLRQTVAAARRALGAEHIETLIAMNDLGSLVPHDQAEQIEREVLSIEMRIFGPEHRETLTTMSNLAMVIDMGGRSDEARAILQRVLEIETRVLGPENPRTLESQGHLYFSYYVRHQFDEAEKTLRAMLDTQLRAFGPDDQSTVDTQFTLARLLMEDHRYPEAEKMARLVVAARQRTKSDPRNDMLLVAQVLKEEHRYAEAEEIARQVLAWAQGTEWNPKNAMRLLAEVLKSEGKPAEANRLSK